MKNLLIALTLIASTTTPAFANDLPLGTAFSQTANNIAKRCNEMTDAKAQYSCNEILQSQMDEEIAIMKRINEYSRRAEIERKEQEASDARAEIERKEQEASGPTSDCPVLQAIEGLCSPLDNLLGGALKSR